MLIRVFFPFTYFIIGYIPALHTETSLADYHYPMMEKYGHAVRLKGGISGVSSPSSFLARTFLVQTGALYITDPAALHAILVRNPNIFEESVEFAGCVILLPQYIQKLID